MKRFLLKFAKYAVAIFLGYIVLLFSWLFLTKELNLNPYSAPGKNVFVVGNSHSQCAIKDTLDIVNFAMGGESVFFSAIKTRQILKANPHAIICIEFYPYSIKSAYINLANNRLPKHYRNYMYYMMADEHWFLLKNNPWKTARVFLSPDFFSVFNKTGGALTASPKAKRKNPIVSERRKSGAEKTWADDVEMQNFYALRDLIDSHPNNLFVLTRMPESRQLKFETTSRYLDCLNQLTQKANVCQIDYSGIEFPDSDFADAEHMNENGQDKVTKLLVADLERIRALK